MLGHSCLEVLDPPSWGPAAAGATVLVRRSHELRRKPLDQFTVEDLRLMVGQQIGLVHLVPFALEKLRIDPLAAGDYYPGDLLASVLRIDRDFWLQQPALARVLRSVLDEFEPQPTDVDMALGDLIGSFDGDDRDREERPD